MLKTYFKTHYKGFSHSSKTANILHLCFITSPGKMIFAVLEL